MGGSGDYFDCADTVIQMQAYRAYDVTEAAREIAASHVTGRAEEHETELTAPAVRALDPKSLDPTVKKGKVKIQAKGADHLVFGGEDVDLRAVEQIADPSQVRAIGRILGHLAEEHGRLVDPPAAVARFLEGEWSGISHKPDGDLARPRVTEVMAALNRLRGARLG
jgi:predicted ABC-class ATPase